MAFLELKTLSKQYVDGKGALINVNLALTSQKKIGVVGETGSGKSTLLKLICGLLQKDQGEILFQEKKVKGPEEKLIAGHPQMQYLSQHFELPSFITVSEHLENIYLIADEEAKKIFSSCQIEHLHEKDTSHLSGGEKQRVALAKALTYEPELLLLDEPFSNLDYLHKRQIKSVIDEVISELKTTIILVAHEPRDVLSWAEEVVVMRHGEVLQKGSPFSIYTRPADEYVAGLFGNYQLVDPDVWKIDKQKYHQIGGKVLIRPEQLKPVQKAGVGVAGVVQRANYQGSHDELIIKVGTEEVIAYDTINKYKVGEKLSLEIVR